MGMGSSNSKLGYNPSDAKLKVTREERRMIICQWNQGAVDT